MKIIRVRLKDFGGVEALDVAFAPTGVTIIHGPNEAGKSTIMRSIDVLFEHRDDSRKEEVRNTKPVNRDVGSEVEAEVEIGEHHFTYFKRFHRDRETRLTIHTPSPANLTGREAHERVQEILGANVDTALWRALRIVQGEHPDMPPLHDQPALALALDRAAGETRSGEREEGIFEAARGEYLRYFTETGMEREDPVVAARRSATESEATAKDLRTQLNALEEDIARCAVLERSVANLKRRLPSLQAAEEKARKHWGEVAVLAEQVQQSTAVFAAAQKAVKAARDAQVSRAASKRAVEVAAAKVNSAESEKTAAQAALAEADTRLDTASKARDAASAAVNGQEELERLRRDDVDFRVEEFELVRMEERLAHVMKADEAAAAAGAVVATTKVTEKLRIRIRDAELALRTQQGIFSAASPRLALRALRILPFTVNGTSQNLGIGESRELAITESTTLLIPETVELTLTPGTSAGELQAAVLEAESELTRACASAGVASAAEAETGWVALQEARRTLADRDRIAKEHLRDLSRDALRKNVADSKARIDAYRKRRTSLAEIAATTEEARSLLEIAVHLANEARSAFQQAKAAYDPAHEDRVNCASACAVKTAMLAQAVQDHAIAVQLLANARNSASDEELARTVETEEAAAKAAGDAAGAARASLGREDAEAAKALLEAAESAAKQAKDQHEELDREHISLRARLDAIGEKGLGESLAEAERKEFEAKDLLSRLLRRAGAASLLYEMLRAEREEMRRAYVAPLRDGIERLGRHVFGDDLQVELNESLQIVTRTLNGVTVPLHMLSTGAREQMGILIRMAAVAVVSKGGAIPLVLDDALGASDEGRLASMSAALRMASRDAQAIILTSTPDRYVHIGAAATIGI